MTQVVVENPANEPMKLGNYSVGVVPTPGLHYEPVLFSDYECTKQFHRMERDVYECQQKNKDFANNLKTPKSLYAILALPFVIWGGSKVVKLFKKIFK